MEFETLIQGNGQAAKLEAVAGHYREMLKSLGEDPDREGLKRTPQRAASALLFLNSGHLVDLQTLLNDAVFSDVNQGMVIIRDIEVYSLCEHHLLPFFGQVHVGYIPNKKVIGISKIPRIVDMFARRLQIQERLTEQVLAALNTVLAPVGAGVVMQCKHMCMMMRGVEKQNSVMFTSSMSGTFLTDRSTRTEFLDLIRTSKN